MRILFFTLIFFTFANHAEVIPTETTYSKSQLQALLDYKPVGRNEIFWGRLQAIKKVGQEEGQLFFEVNSVTPGGNTCAQVKIKSKQSTPKTESDRSSDEVTSKVTAVSLPYKCSDLKPSLCDFKIYEGTPDEFDVHLNMTKNLFRNCYQMQVQYGADKGFYPCEEIREYAYSAKEILQDGWVQKALKDIGVSPQTVHSLSLFRAKLGDSDGGALFMVHYRLKGNPDLKIVGARSTMAGLKGYACQ